MKMGRPSEKDLYDSIKQRDAEIEEWKKKHEVLRIENMKLRATLLNKMLGEIKVLPQTSIITSE